MPAVRLPLRVYFLHGGQPVSVLRTPLVKGRAVATSAVGALLQGPTRREHAAGLTDAVRDRQRVTFRLDGRRLTVLGGEGILLDKPVTRAGFTALLPPIFVDTPARGATVRSPVRVSGLADLYKGQFLLELRRADGTVLARSPARAETGMYAPFSVTRSFPVSMTQTGFVVAYDRSPKDGPVIDLVTTPVTLHE